MRAFLARHTLAVATLLTAVIGAAIGLYINLLTTSLAGDKSGGLPQEVADLKWWNLVWLLSAAGLWAQIYVSGLPRRHLMSQKDELIRAILEAACRTFIYPTSTRHIRAFVTLRDGSTGRRVTRYYYNAEGDPERTASYPLAFGITGQAYVARSVVAAELPPDHHAHYDSDAQGGVLPQVRSILAAPILQSDRHEDEPFGVLAFDTTLPMKTVKFDQLPARAVAQGWADILALLLRLPTEG